MPDSLTPEQRRRCMAAIHSRDTKPEMMVRRWLWARGFRFRLSHPRLPGRPDIVLLKYRAVIFVNGCFWHGHEGCKSFQIPKTHTEFWRDKIEKNRERDTRERHMLAAMGWHTIVVWECELRPSVRETTLRAIELTLERLWLADHTAPLVRQDEESTSEPHSQSYQTFAEEQTDTAAEAAQEYGVSE